MTPLIDVSVLDDDLDFLRYAEDLLADEGRYSIRTFSHPRAMFTAFEETPPEIVLLDMKMGEVKGENVLEQLLARYPGLCVIIVTGYPSLETMRATFKLKVFDYLAKPFSLSQLRSSLENAAQTYGLGVPLLDRLRGRLGHRIKVLRAERNWSLKDLSGAAGLSVSQVSSIERGAHMPSIDSLLAICQALELRPSALFASIDF